MCFEEGTLSLTVTVRLPNEVISSKISEYEKVRKTPSGSLAVSA